MKICFTCLICFVSSLLFSQTQTQHKPVTKQKTVSHKPMKQGEMKPYFIVFLIKGEKRDQDSATAAKIQTEHLAHLTKMGNEGKLDIAGPFLDDEDVRGICIYNVATIEEATMLAESDPAVKAGRLKVKVRPWYSMKGAVLR